MCGTGGQQHHSLCQAPQAQALRRPMPPSFDPHTLCGYSAHLIWMCGTGGGRQHHSCQASEAQAQGRAVPPSYVPHTLYGNFCSMPDLDVGLEEVSHITAVELLKLRLSFVSCLLHTFHILFVAILLIA